MNEYDDEMVEAASLIIAASGITSEEMLARFQAVLTKDVAADLLLITYYGGDDETTNWFRSDTRS